MQNVLLLEDDPTNSENLVDWLQARQVNVTPIFGVKKLIDYDQSLGFLAITPAGKDVEIDLSGYQLAIVDGELLGRFSGWDLIPALVDAGIVCVAHSSESNFNDKMLKAGAQHAAVKLGLRNIKAVLAKIDPPRFA